jgi:hypothetical protein
VTQFVDRVARCRIRGVELLVTERTTARGSSDVRAELLDRRPESAVGLADGDLREGE